MEPFSWLIRFITINHGMVTKDPLPYSLNIEYNYLSEIILQVDGVDPLTLFGQKNRNLTLVRDAIP